jgi:hypothetical protein
MAKEIKHERKTFQIRKRINHSERGSLKGQALGKWSEGGQQKHRESHEQLQQGTDGFIQTCGEKLQPYPTFEINASNAANCTGSRFDSIGFI